MGADAAIRMPQLGLTMTEGLLVEWLAKPGHPIAAGQLLFVVETDKIANEVAADRDGMLAEILVPAGETVPVGTVIAQWSGAEAAAERETTPVRAAAAEARMHPQPVPASPPAPAPAPPAGGAAASTRLLATPHARKLARAQGIDLRQLRGSGPKGRIRGVDVRQAAGAVARTLEPAATRIPLTAPQQVVAARMVKSKQEIPHFYLEAEANIGDLLALHRQLKPRAEFGKLTLTHWIVHAVGLAIAAQARFRRVFDNGEYVELAGSDVALAAATDRGLYVPVARAVATQTLAANAERIEALVRRAREGRLTAAESTGGATCVSNLGGSGVRRVLPIILPGQSSILGVGRLNELFRPDATGAPKLAREIALVLSCDHRVLNGIDGARFLEAITARLEDPLSLLLEQGA